MSIHVEIPEPLATQVAEAAKSHATSLEHYVIDAVAKTVAEDAVPTHLPLDNDKNNPLVGLLVDDPELADFLSQNAYEMRSALPIRTPRE